MADGVIVQAACHCRRVRFEVTPTDSLKTAQRCNCSFCRMRGAVAVSAEYQFNTRTAKHYFCSVCGIYTHQKRRSNPRQFGVNAACLEGVSPFDFLEVPVTDGVHHPSDAGAGATSRLAGVLRYEAASD